MAGNASSFPEGFYWGASTASHQVEGGTINQWSVWELAHASELAKTAEKRLGWLPNWEQVKDQATNPNNYVSGEGVDHYRRYKEDFDLAKKLHLNSFRFGIEWARVEPIEGKWDKAEIEHYRQYIKAMKARDLEPFLNLWHWTLPTWFTDKGGFAKRDNLQYFERFVAMVGDEFGEELTYVITLNEPNVYASHSYGFGEWVPQERNPLKAFWVYCNLITAHKQAYRILKTLHPKLQIGIAQAMSLSRPKRPAHFLDRAAAVLTDYAWNYWFVNRIREQQDFIGFNFYMTNYIKGFKRANPAKPVNDLGWYMEPGRVYDLVMELHRRYKKPILIAENGVADAKDEYRQWWVKETIHAIERSVRHGAKLIGYMHWSLLDNFEWKYGWWPKFGLIEVDREQGMKRKIRKSAAYYAKIIKS